MDTGSHEQRYSSKSHRLVQFNGRYVDEVVVASAASYGDLLSWECNAMQCNTVVVAVERVVEHQMMIYLDE